eukprot:CAMPEP_0197499332 /NCGR_PEP_ID=MMETSP1311-20131121/60953_1 /TAXON_ID=464262 /ORGANISM="Genus nov. species nov., Strain RCC856" /LENGTH=1102 /DNA_ID=CAMNT_0043045075 /DNA_START=1366 /DNA_END=4673 /DNA_ORIENTATION=-
MRMRRPRLARAGSLAAAVFCLAALCSPTRVLSLFEVCDTFGDDGCQDEGSVCKTIFKPGGVMAKVCVCDESSGYWHGGGDLGCVEIPGFCIEDSDCESEVYGDNYYNPVCDHKIDRCTCEHLGWEPGTYVHNGVYGDNYYNPVCDHKIDRCTCEHLGWEPGTYVLNGEGICGWPTFGECETDEDCNEGAICSGIEVPSLEPGWEPGNLDPIPFMCICAEGYIYDSAGGGTCIQKETLGNVCSTDADCIIPNGWSENQVCKLTYESSPPSWSKKCVCASGYWHGGGDLGCVEIPGFCIEDSDCNEGNEDHYYSQVCDHKIDRCTCEHLGWEPGTYVHNGEGLCAWPTFGECETDEDCSANEGTVCEGVDVPTLESGNWEPWDLTFVCVCAEGYIHDFAGGGTCIQKETLGNVCSTDADCIIPNGWSENQVCQLTYESSPPSWSKKCVCDNGYEAVEGKCKAIPGYCEEGGDCRHPERTWWSSFNPFDKQCVNTRCVCTNSYVEDESTYGCTPPGPADSCDSSSDCNAENNEVCASFLDVGYVEDESTYGCTPPGPADSCDSSSDCNAENNEVCASFLDVGENSWEQIFNRICVCAKGYTFDVSSGDCLPSDSLGKPCSFGDCGTNEVCKVNIEGELYAETCQCDAANDWEDNGDGVCVWNSEFCTTNQQCAFQNNNPTSENKVCDVENQICVCPPGSKLDIYGTGCDLISLGNVCSEDKDCSTDNGFGENQVCKLMYESSPPSWSKKCVCDTGYEAVESICEEIPDFCVKDYDCRNPEKNTWSSADPFNKKCVANRCVCSIPYVEDESTYTCTYPGPANSCDSSSDCNAENNEGCFLFNNEGQMCICAIGYTFDPSSGDCLPSDTLGKPCPVFGDCGTNEICKVTIEGGLYAETCECDAANGWMDDGDGVCVWNWNFCTTNQQCANQIVDSINPASVDKVCDMDKRECVCPPGSNLDIYETGCDPIPGYCSEDADCSVPCEVPGSPGIGCSADNGKICDIEKNVCTLPGTIDLPDWGEGPTPVQPNQESEPAPGLLTFPTLPSNPGPGLATSGFSFERRGRKEDSREEDRRQDDEDRDQDRDEDRDEDDDEEDFRLATLTLGR